MNRHASTEQLSAYLDSELGVAEIRQLEKHCQGCEECGARLVSMRRVVAGLGRVERAVPPAALRQQIRRQVITQQPIYGVRKAFDSLRFLLFPVQPALHTALVMGLAVVVGLVTLNHEAESLMPPPTRAGQEIVTVQTGAQLGYPFTTSKVADREFFWTDSGWIQKGLEGQTPVTRVEAGSPQGRALLTRCSGLEDLLADGQPVVLRYNLKTVEIHKLPSTRELGFEAQPVVHVHGRTVTT
jgi:hypothetical protein